MSSYALVWDLDSIMPHPKTEEFQQVFERFRADLTQLADALQSLPSPKGDAETAAAWKSFLKSYEGAVCQASELASFIGCHAAADADNKLFQQYEARLSTLFPLQAQIATNLEFAVKQASEVNLTAMISAEAYLQEIESSYRKPSCDAALRLPKEQELLAADLAVDGFQAWGRLYDRISGGISHFRDGEGRSGARSPSARCSSTWSNVPSARTISTPPTKPGARLPTPAPMPSTISRARASPSIAGWASKTISTPRSA